MIAGDVVDLGAFGSHFQDALKHLYVFLRKVALSKLPHIDEVTVEDERLCFDALQVVEQFFGVAAVSSEVDVRNDDDVKFPLHIHLSGVLPDGRTGI